MFQLSHHHFIRQIDYGIGFIHLLLPSTLGAIFTLAVKSEAVKESLTAKRVYRVSEMPLATARALFNLSPYLHCPFQCSK